MAATCRVDSLRYSVKVCGWGIIILRGYYLSVASDQVDDEISIWCEKRHSSMFCNPFFIEESHNYAYARSAEFLVRCVQSVAN